MNKGTGAPGDDEILPGMEMIGLTLYLRQEDTLVFGDLHLGFEEELNDLGYMIPRFQYEEIVAHLRKVFLKIRGKKKLARIVVDGDLKHEFGRISAQEWQEVLNFLDFLSGNADEIILAKGNHDSIIGPIAGKKNVRLVEKYFLPKRRIYITHGDKIPSDDEDYDKAKTIIVAHDHPAVALRSGVRTEKVKCFLRGKWKRKDLIQIPSLNFVTEGSDLLEEGALSPFMQKNKGAFEVYAVEGFKVFRFGKLKHLEKEKGIKI